MTRVLTIAIIFIIGLSWSTAKEMYFYELCVPFDADSSKIVYDELIGISDSVSVYFSGQVIDMNSKKTCHGAVVSLIDIESGKPFGKFTDSLGQFSLIVPPGNYVFEVSFAGCTSIKNNLILEKGEIRKMKIELGSGGGFATYEIKSEKKLNQKQLKKKYKKLKKELKK